MYIHVCIYVYIRMYICKYIHIQRSIHIIIYKITLRGLIFTEAYYVYSGTSV
jgi:hypothetical protein